MGPDKEPLGFAAPPLTGIRVIEIGDYLSVGYAGSMLGDFGAEVIKIDLPGHIDNNRQIGGTDAIDPARSPHFVALARNKKSISLDVRTEKGSRLFLDLIAKSNVLIENFRPGTLERWGIGPAECAKRNPDIVILRLSGFGQDGPDRNRASVDHVAQAFAGVTYVTGYADSPPVRMGIPVADCAGALVGAFGVVLALLAHWRDKGADTTSQVVDVALYDPFMPMLGAHAARFNRYGEVRERMGNSWAGVTPGGCYSTMDGMWVAIDATGDTPFARLARTIGHPEWASDPRLASRSLRYEHREEIEEELGQWIANRSAADAVDQLTRAQVGAARVNSIEDLINDPQVKARKSFIEITDDTYGSILVPSPTPKLGRTPGTIRASAPRPGEHNDEIYQEVLGMSTDEIASLVRSGIV